ncbi:MAG: hypothetical protein H6Q33_175 [Deltaproteobacteria bacterium]|nr:hypothetical protein [Deltaproteobacteria bacterium]
MAALPCPTCGYRYSLMERCGPAEPAPDCTGLDGTHWHRHCVRCLAAWIVLSDVGKPIPDPDPTLH